MPATLPPAAEAAELSARLLELGWHGAARLLPDLVQSNRSPRAALQLLQRLADEEAQQRAARSLDRRQRRAHIGAFKPIAAFDWNWPTEIDRARLEAALHLRFVDPGDNLVMVGEHGLGKTTLMRNIAHNAVLAGHTVCVTTAQKMLQDLASIDSPSRLRLALGQLAAFDVLCIDELGYLSYSERAADLFYDLVNRRYDARRSIVISTNLYFKDWTSVFPNATCAGAIIARLVHRADVVRIRGTSWRLKEARERAGAIDPDAVSDAADQPLTRVDDEQEDA
ncbi:MAG: ATP-binding protein [Myxococcales bacterium]|nr:ATP-binding protein [Myxococcales bacterium]